MTAAKNAIVSWLLNFRIRMFVKTAVRGGDPEARPLGTYETQMVARTGESSALKILPTIGDCERSKEMLN